MRIPFTLLLAALLLAQPALAQSGSEDAPDCSQAMSTVDIVTCSGIERAKWDKRLNSAYSRLMSKLDRAQAAQLRDLQRKWIAFRDAQCGFNLETGTMVLIERAGCFEEQTKQQSEFLDQTLNSME